MKWKYQTLRILAILTNCLGTRSSLNFNLLEKGEMPTDPVSRTTPVLSFYVLDLVVMGNGMERKGKNVIWILYDSIRIKDTRKTEKRLFSVENGKRRKRQYGLKMYIGRGINKLDFRQKSFSSFIQIKHIKKTHLNCLNFN